MADDWKPLPPRNRSRHNHQANATPSVNTSNDLIAIPAPQHVRKERKVIEKLAAIADNIASRTIDGGGVASHDDIRDEEGADDDNTPKRRKLADGSIEPKKNNPDVLPNASYEYLPHPADIQLHSWGSDFSSALSSLAVAMFGYMTDLFVVETLEETRIAVIEGHDKESIVFNFLEEWLFTFHSTGFIAKEVSVSTGNTTSNTISSVGRGEKMDLKKHKQGTEVKAITYSAMKIVEADESEDGQFHIYCIVDI